MSARRRGPLCGLAGLALGAALGCSGAAPVTTPPPSPPAARGPADRVEPPSTLVRYRTTEDACGRVRFTSPPTLEGVAADGSVAWVFRHNTPGAVATLADGGGLAFVDGWTAQPTSLRLSPDGRILWAHRWPSPESTHAGPSRRTLGPDPATFIGLTFVGEELAFWFEDRNVSGFGEGLDVWTFGGDGSFLARRRRTFDGTIDAFLGANAVYVQRHDAAAVEIFGLDGGHVTSATVAPHAALARTASQASTFLTGGPSVASLDVLVSGDGVLAVDKTSRPVWSFGATADVIAAEGTAWGGVALVTARCELTLLDRAGELVWTRPLQTTPDARCEESVSVTSDDAAVVVAGTLGEPVYGLAVAYDKRGRFLFRTDIGGSPSHQQPVLERGRAFMRVCATGAEVPLPSLVPRVDDVVSWDAMGAVLERELDVPVSAFVATGPNDAAALSRGRLFRFDGKRWRDTGPLRATVKLPRREGITYGPLEAHGLAAGHGALFVTAGSEVSTTPSPLSGGVAYREGWQPALLEQKGHRFAEVAAMSATFATSATLTYGVDGGPPATHVLPGADDTLVCHDNWCQRIVDGTAAPIATPSNWFTTALARVDGVAWVLGPTLARVEGNELVSLGVKAMTTNGKPAVQTLWGRDAKALWLLDGAVRRVDTTALTNPAANAATPTGANVPTTTVAVPLKRPRGIGGTAANDVWLVGDDGVAHFDGERWARVVSAGTPKLSIVAAHGDALWLAGDDGLFRVKSARAHERRGAAGPKAKVAKTVQTTTVVEPAATTLATSRVTLRAGGRTVDRAHELAASDATLWIRDHAGVIAHDGVTTRSIARREDVGGFACRRCLAPHSSTAGYLLGGALFEVKDGRPRRLDEGLDRMLSIALDPLGRAPLPLRVGGGPLHPELPAARWLDEGTYGWDVPEGCYTAIATADDETWLAGGRRCVAGDWAPWPDGEGVLVHRTPRGVTVHRIPGGPLLAVATSGRGRAFAVGTGGVVVRVDQGVLERYQPSTAARLHAVVVSGAPQAPEVWIGGDDRTLIRRDPQGAFTYVSPETLPLPPRATILSLAQHQGRLWIASPDGLLRAK